MAVYYLNSAQADDLGAGTSWATAKKTMAGIIAIPITNADTVWVAPTHSETITGPTTHTFPTSPGLRVLCADSTANEPPTGLGTGATTAASGNMGMATVGCAYFYGMTWIKSGGTGGSVALLFGSSTAVRSNLFFDTCTVDWTTSQTTRGIGLGGSVSDGGDPATIRWFNCTIRNRHASNWYSFGNGLIEFIDCSFPLSSGGTALTTMFQGSTQGAAVGDVLFQGCDLSGMAFTNLFNGDHQLSLRFVSCKMPASYALTPARTYTQLVGGRAALVDCASGDTHMEFVESTPTGGLVTNSTTYRTAGAAGKSWQITTPTGVTRDAPYMSPWIDLYVSDTSTSIQPWIEILRNNDSTSAWTDAEVWIEVMAKTTASSTDTTEYADCVAVLGTPTSQATGVGTGAWSGTTGSCWSGKLQVPAAFTPAEVGYIRARVCVAVTTDKLFIDPQIRI